MVTAKLTSKGQLTIPKTVRESLHLQAGDRVSFTLNPAGEVMMKPVTTSVDDVFGILHHPDQEPLSPKAMKKAAAKRLKKKFV